MTAVPWYLLSGFGKLPYPKGESDVRSGPYTTILLGPQSSYMGNLLGSKYIPYTVYLP